MTATTKPKPASSKRSSKSPSTAQLQRTPQSHHSAIGDNAFRYVALDTEGTVRNGTIHASSSSEAAARVRSIGMRPLEVEPEKPSMLKMEFQIPGFGPKVSNTEVAAFTRQFATMLSSGIPLVRSLTILAEQATNPLLLRTLSSLRTDVESGDSLSRAVSKHPAVFDDLFVPTIAAGESAGALDDVLKQLATTLERSVAIRHKIKSALTYPVAVLFLVAGVLIAMLLVVVPVFAGIYDDLGGSLPLPTRVLVAASAALTTNLPITLLVTASTVVGFRRWKRSDQGHLAWDRWKLRAPLVGDLIHKSTIARLTRILAVLNAAGVPILDSLEVAARTVGNLAIEESTMSVRKQVQDGGSIASNMAKDELFDPIVVQLVAIGEETGTLDEMLVTVSNTYEEEVESAVAGFASLIEPLLMAFIGVVVGGMVVSLYLPMFRIVDLVQ